MTARIFNMTGHELNQSFLDRVDANEEFKIDPDDFSQEFDRRLSINPKVNYSLGMGLVGLILAYEMADLNPETLNLTDWVFVFAKDDSRLERFERAVRVAVSLIRPAVCIFERHRNGWLIAA